MASHTGDNGSNNTSRQPRNFSRPQPPPPKKPVPSKYQDRHIPIVSALHEPNRAVPHQPRVSVESERTDNTSSENSAGSEFAWDGHAGELDSRSRKQRFDAQRSEARSRPMTSTTIRAEPTVRPSADTFDLGLPAGVTRTDSVTPDIQIIKRISVDQQSERISTSTARGEDSASHHTVSNSGESSGSRNAQGRWQSSDYDISGLSEAEIRKLEKKGINPALYMEMKEARKGKKWTPSLLGNGFLN